LRKPVIEFFLIRLAPVFMFPSSDDPFRSTRTNEVASAAIQLQFLVFVAHGFLRLSSALP
jgi:hypothetical protein